MGRTILKDGKLDIGTLMELQKRPGLFERGDAVLWTDPHISGQILQTHLDPDTEKASRKCSDIEATVRWIAGDIGMQAGDRVLDLGCGPGLYTERLAQMGFKVTGVDQSERSVMFARERAVELGLSVEYHTMDLLDITWKNDFDLVSMIYVDLGTFSDTDRDSLFAVVRRCLRPGGRFLFDTRTISSPDNRTPRDGWTVREEGFWSPDPHLLLENILCYPEEDVTLEQYVVVKSDGTTTTYRVWTRFYTEKRMDLVLERAGFELLGRWDDLRGTPWSGDSEWMGVLTRKRSADPL